MAKLKTYDVTYNGTPTTMKLTDEEAERLGATEAKAAKTSSTKKRTAKNKAADSESS